MWHDIKMPICSVRTRASPLGFDSQMNTPTLLEQPLSDHSVTSSSSDTESSTISAQQTPRKTKRSKTRRRPRRGANKSTLSEQEQAQYLALDCEMVGVGEYGQFSALARVTIVDYQHEIVYDEFVRPHMPVTDYRTFVSGITADDLVGAKTLKECREEVAAILDGKILIGHALKNDLQALGLRHPWQQTRDTAKYEPFMKVRFEDGVLWPRKLRDLAQQHLQRDIQAPGQAHSAYEDAVAALDLYKSVRSRWEKVMDYKINKTREIEAQQQSTQ